MAEPQKESWLKLVALTVIILAVASGLAAFKSAAYATRVQLDTAREARLWQDYQVDSISKDTIGMNRDLLGFLKPLEGKTVKGHKPLAAKIKEYEDEIKRLNQERDQIKKDAQILGMQEEISAKKAGQLGLAMILFQLAIMSSATAALIRKKILWLAGLGLGVWGLVYLVMGWVL
ncbi:MAG: DUF4337 family protein [Syntrophobacterales bacterium]|jgi:hypothetical protein|nr:DUF4337 family protein [Syntrophobacterales bacterium]